MLEHDETESPVHIVVQPPLEQKPSVSGACGAGVWHGSREPGAGTRRGDEFGLRLGQLVKHLSDAAREIVPVGEMFFKIRDGAHFPRVAIVDRHFENGSVARLLNVSHNTAPDVRSPRMNADPMRCLLTPQNIHATHLSVSRRMPGKNLDRQFAFPVRSNGHAFITIYQRSNCAANNPEILNFQAVQLYRDGNVTDGAPPTLEQIERCVARIGAGEAMVRTIRDADSKSRPSWVLGNDGTETRLRIQMTSSIESAGFLSALIARAGPLRYRKTAQPTAPASDKSLRTTKLRCAVGNESQTVMSLSASTFNDLTAETQRRVGRFGATRRNASTSKNGSVSITSFPDQLRS